MEDLRLAFSPIQHLDIEYLLYVLSRTWGRKDKKIRVCVAFYNNILSCSFLCPGEMPHVWVSTPTPFSDLSSVVWPSCGFDVMAFRNWAFMGRPLATALPRPWVDLNRLGGAARVRLSTMNTHCGCPHPHEDNCGWPAAMGK